MLNKIVLRLLSYLVFLISIISVILLNIDNKTKIIVIILSLLIFAYLEYKDKIGQELVVSFLFSLFIVSYFNYDYFSSNLFIGKLNLFPLIGWSGGLVLLREIYECIKVKPLGKFILTCFIYWFLLFFLEYIGYNFGGIRLSSDYPGLLGFNFMHASLLMKSFYILTGPVYLLITDYLKVK